MARERRIVALALALAVTAGAASAEAPFTGAFSGTGRACYGRLYVRSKTISWLTPFSQCQRVPYRVIERHQSGNARAITFALRSRPKGCRYGIVHLRHRDEPDPRIGWEVIGYATLDDSRADQARGFKVDLETAMSCYLVAE